MIERELRPPTDPVFGTLLLPDEGKPTAAVLVIGGSGGVEPTFVARPLAAAGFAALSVAFFKRPGLPASLREIPLEYFRDALRVLHSALPAGGVPVLALGMSRTSEAALLTAVHFPELVDGVISSVPGNVVVCSWPPGGPAWLLDGRPLPYVSHFGPYSENPDAIIPVERILGPLLLISAGSDGVWPSAAMARAISKRRAAYGPPPGDDVLEYPDATHSLGYLIPELPEGLLLPGTNDWPADQTARADAWPKILEFVRRCPVSRPTAR